MPQGLLKKCRGQMLGKLGKMSLAIDLNQSLTLAVEHPHVTEQKSHDRCSKRRQTDGGKRSKGHAQWGRYLKGRRGENLGDFPCGEHHGKRGGMVAPEYSARNKRCGYRPNRGHQPSAPADCHPEHHREQGREHHREQHHLAVQSLTQPTPRGVEPAVGSTAAYYEVQYPVNVMQTAITSGCSPERRPPLRCLVSPPKIGNPGSWIYFQASAVSRSPYAITWCKI